MNRKPPRVARSLSYSEISTALTCPARWDFAYGDRLAGSSLRRKSISTTLSDGRAWGAAVAAWHGFRPRDDLYSAYDPQLARQAAHVALGEAYRADIAEQAKAGVYVDPELEVKHTTRLHALLEHYMDTADRLPNLTQLEGYFNVPLWSRTGMQRSTKYRFEGKIDGFTELDEDGGEWIVEFKLRGQLTPRKQLDLDRQQLWYAWARQQMSDIPVVGVILDERLNRVPDPARTLVNGMPSEAVSEMTTELSYLELCGELGVEPVPAKIEALRARRWQQRVPILFRPGQLAEASLELVAAGQFIHELDAGHMWPVRNAHRPVCGGCRFADICSNPQDHLYVESLYERVEPKRHRERKEG